MRFQRILIALDDSQQAEWALDTGIELAEALHAHVLLVHVVNPTVAYVGAGELLASDVLAEMRERGEELLLRARMRAGESVPKECAMLEGSAAREIIGAAEEWDCDLIVMGTHGRGRVASFLMGSTTQEVIREARCPVLAIPDRPSPARKERAGGVTGALSS